MRAKSLLLTPVLLLLSGLVILSLIAAVTTGETASWIGVALAAAPLPAFVSYVMARENVARTSENLPSAFAASGIGVLVTVLFFAGAAQTILAVSAFGFLLWYVFIYSTFGRQPSKTIRLHQPLPAFDLENIAGARVPSSTFTKTPALFLFYRGNWCPLCMAQIREVADAYKTLSTEGVEVVLVSPQPPGQTAKLAAKFDVPFRFMIDRDSQAARTLDIFAKGGTPLGIDAMGYGSDTVLPTIIATNANGHVIYHDQTDNYRVRPEPETFLSIFQQNNIAVGAAA